MFSHHIVSHRAHFPFRACCSIPGFNKPRSTWAQCAEPPPLAQASPLKEAHFPLSCPQASSRKMNYTSPLTHVNKPKKFRIYSAVFKPSPPAQGGLKRTSKKPEFQLKHCDHPGDTKIFLWLVRCALWTVWLKKAFRTLNKCSNSLSYFFSFLKVSKNFIFKVKDK